MARVAIDLHGGDFGPSVIIPSSLKFFRENPQHYGVLVGDRSVVVRHDSSVPKNVEWIDAAPIGDASQKPSRLLRRDGNSSIEICYRALKNKDVDVVVSGEHTGVLLVLMSKYGSLHSLLSRPVLVSWLPGLECSSVMLDLGASFTASCDQLLAYAAIGVGVVKKNQVKPSLGLINVGTEFFKGPSEIRDAHKSLMKWKGIEYKGFIEASEVFKGELDIIVVDGFTGNSIIKASEGALELTFKSLNLHLNKGFFSRFLALWLRKKMGTVLRPLDPDFSNGALVSGSDLLVVKSHGHAGESAFRSALDRAVWAFDLNIVPSVWSELDALFDEAGFLFDV